jgi:hypothetical protein
MKRIPLLFFTFLFVSKCFSQEYQVSGKILSADKKEILISANIFMTKISEKEKNGTYSDKNGNFLIKKLLPAKYSLKISLVGYKSYEKNIEIKKHNVDIGTIYLEMDSIVLKEVTAEGKAILMQKIGDTTQYDAKAVKLNDDALTEDLLKRLPGIEVSRGGEIKSKGEKIDKLLIDKKPFFGKAKKAALENVPAKMVDKVQVYDEESKQSQITGFSDGNTTKVMNLATKPGNRLVKNSSLKLLSGYGPDDRYQSAGGYNHRDTSQSYVLIAGSTNLNTRGNNSSFIEQLGGMPGFFHTSRGLNNGDGHTSDININYDIGRMTKDKFAVQYSFNSSNIKSESWLNRKYLESTGLNQNYSQKQNTEEKNYKHFLDLNYDSEIDDETTLEISPKIEFSKNNGSSLSGNKTMLNESLVSDIKTISESDENNYTISGAISFNRKMSLSGDNFSLKIEGEINNNRSNYNWENYDNIAVTEGSLVRNISRRDFMSKNVISNMDYTMILDSNHVFQISYDVKYCYDDDKNPKQNVTDEGYILDSASSSNYENNTWIYCPAIGYNYKKYDLNININLSYSISKYAKTQELPLIVNDDRSFKNIISALNMKYKIWTNSLDLRYSSQVNIPSLDRLQNVLNDKNSLLLSIGNPALKEAIRHFVSIDLLHGKTGFFKYFDFGISGKIEHNYIGNARILAANDTIVLNNIALKRGVQINYPINFNKYLSGSASIKYFGALDGLGIASTLIYSAGKTPALFNNMELYTINNLTSWSMQLTTNFSKDWTANLTFNFVNNVTHSDNNLGMNTNYNTISTTLNGEYTFPFNLRFDIDAQDVYNTLSRGSNKDNFMINLYVSQKFFNKKAELKFSVYDLLNDTKNINTYYSDIYVEERKQNLPQRNFILSFSYKLNEIN